MGALVFCMALQMTGFAMILCIVGPSLGGFPYGCFGYAVPFVAPVAMTVGALLRAVFRIIPV